MAAWLYLPPLVQRGDEHSACGEPAFAYLKAETVVLCLAAPGVLWASQAFVTFSALLPSSCNLF